MDHEEHPKKQTDGLFLPDNFSSILSIIPEHVRKGVSTDHSDLVQSQFYKYSARTCDKYLNQHISRGIFKFNNKERKMENLKKEIEQLKKKEMLFY